MNRIPRVVVLGSTAVGKTSIINRIIEGTFDPTTPPTTGAGYFVYKPSNYGGKEIQIWDTAGMERYRSMNQVYYRDALGAILMFNLTDLDSFNDLDSWLTDLLNATKKKPFIILVGNKSDLQDKIVVSKAQILTFCENYSGIPYFETSALNGEGVQTMIDALVAGLPKTYDMASSPTEENPSSFKCC
ncbi:hypothetical protein M9Y10_029299 [Tritrichomonas musculus]|uniref:Small GTP-binding protein n=1 Tax=Tritrichomonas musculus TaxID=1915356 RepID=A0ABR2KMD6_9EUKA